MKSHGYEYITINVEDRDPDELDTVFNDFGKQCYYIAGCNEKLVFMCRSRLPPVGPTKKPDDEITHYHES